MSEVAQYAVRDGIAVITMNNPPVNGLGNALRAGLMAALQEGRGRPGGEGRGDHRLGQGVLRRRRHPRVRQDRARSPICSRSTTSRTR